MASSRPLDEAGVPNAPLLAVDQVAEHPQTRALDMTVTCDGDELPLVGVPLAFDGERPRTRRRAPALGEHDAILKKLKGAPGAD
jgi:crotonobetainyl-CoA:carnitine CoA-transferase CaiB-like acyl-CoA transferase